MDLVRTGESEDLVDSFGSSFALGWSLDFDSPDELFGADAVVVSFSSDAFEAFWAAFFLPRLGSFGASFFLLSSALFSLAPAEALSPDFSAV